MNFDYLNRQFKKYTGDTIFRFLNGYRIEESKRFLKSEQYSNAAIASMTGFQNEFYFSKVFYFFIEFLRFLCHTKKVVA